MQRLICLLSLSSLVWAQPRVPEKAKPYLEAALAAGQNFVVVSAASQTPNLAPGSLASAYGSNLASQSASGTAPYPTTLGGAALQVVDAGGVSRAAQLIYVSPSQINFLVPVDTAPGAVTFNLTTGSNPALAATGVIQNVAPALFTANGDGMGVVSATAVRSVVPVGPYSPVTVFQCGNTPGSCVSVPIDVGLDAPVTLTLYATGIRFRSADSNVMVTIGSQTIPARFVASFDPPDLLAGIDQVMVVLPIGLRGSGEVNVVLTVDGMQSNAGRLNIQ